MIGVIRPNLDEIKDLCIEIKGVKLLVGCPKCGRAWSIWFRDEQDLLSNLPANWYLCSGCKNSESDRELNVKNNGPKSITV